MKTQTYKDLIVWQKSKKLVIEIYYLTEQFHPDEKFGIISQFNRAAISVPLNIAEGYRRRGDKEKKQFFTIAFGSAAEIEALIDICKDLPKFKNIDFSKAENLLSEVLRMLNSFILNSSPISIRYSLNSKFSKNGFSLLELLIYTAVLVVLATVMVSVLLVIAKGRGKFAAQAEVNSNLRFAIEKINQDIRLASLVTAPASPGGTISSNIIMTTGEGEITYCISSNKLRRQVNGACNDSSAIVTSDKVNVTALNFTRFENTNSVLPVTVISIQTFIAVAYASVSPDFQYSATKTTTELLP